MDIRDANDELAKQSHVTEEVPLSTEYFGFAYYLTASVVLIIYIIWAFTPQAWLESIQIYYYPSRWWALTVPAFVLVLLMYIYVALTSYNIEVLTFDPIRPETITDLDAKIDGDYLFAHSAAVRDLPLDKVCQVLYSDIK
ncbi:Meiotically up-regulated gene 84 protein [Wickerhamiella sorbophila]|uniref:Meiotically up-regulated gene 84 protein n=1 Tax=Wickerhamiella sorbophila TaxID=45607 RepID=A0A2T0FCX9_9ASCO|nr:Meiotically up-regulated gene 84 protein [Wickerhamiella sorbophila]PRT52820.1 Meiotically up-regulated gene 84 protein [Wickerhamiella sorbophila]